MNSNTAQTLQREDDGGYRGRYMTDNAPLIGGDNADEVGDEGTDDVGEYSDDLRIERVSVDNPSRKVLSIHNIPPLTPLTEDDDDDDRYVTRNVSDDDLHASVHDMDSSEHDDNDSVALLSPSSLLRKGKEQFRTLSNSPLENKGSVARYFVFSCFHFRSRIL